MPLRSLPACLALMAGLAGLTPALTAAQAPKAPGLESQDLKSQNLKSQNLKSQGLETIVHQALASDPRLNIADSQLNISRSREDQAWGALLPQVSANANISKNYQRQSGALGTTSENFSGRRFSLGAQQVVYDRTRFQALERTQELVGQRQQEFAHTRSQIMLEALERYVAVLAAQDDLRLVDEEQRAIEQQLAQTQRLYERQLVKVTDLYEVETRLDAVRARRIEAANQIEVEREALAELTGQRPQQLHRLAQDVDFDQPSQALQGWLQMATQSNFQLRALEKALAAARRGVEEARGGHYPSVGLTLNAQQRNTGFDNTASPETDSAYLALSLDVPLYTGGTTSARVEEALNRRALAQMELEQAERRLHKDVTQAFLGVESTLERIQANRRSRETAKKTVQAMRTSLEFGAVTAIDVVNALQRQFQAQRELLQAQYDHLVFRARLLFQAGELDEARIDHFQKWLEDA